MTNDIAIRDDMKSVERWENEGGRVSPLNKREEIKVEFWFSLNTPKALANSSPRLERQRQPWVMNSQHAKPDSVRRLGKPFRWTPGLSQARTLGSN
jgi:hypothetical protein